MFLIEKTEFWKLQNQINGMCNSKEVLQQGNLQHKFKYYALKEDGVLMYKGKVFVPNSREMKSILLRELHNMPYARHPGYQKTIAAVRGQYFWPGMKKDVAEYIAKCMECQKVKAENKHLVGLLQPLGISE